MAAERNQSVGTLLSFLREPVNIAENIDENRLNEIGRKAVEGFQADTESMQDWVDAVEKGLELVKPGVRPKSDPWPNAANFKSPIIIDSALRFGDRASQILLSGPNFVKPSVVGKDNDGLKLKRGERAAGYMNWQLNVEMRNWVKEHDKMVYDVAYLGNVFKKTFFSREKQTNVSELITYPAFAVNHNIASLDEARRFTHIMIFPKNIVIERQRAGIWLDIDLINAAPEDDEEAPGDDNNEFLEQETYIDLDGDGYEEPYTITVHKASSKVVRIIPRFDESSILIKDNRTQEINKLIDLNMGADIDFSFERFDVIKIDPIEAVTSYGFLPNPDGGFLNIGYFHLLAPINAAINTSTNSLLNSGMLANMQGGWMAKNGRQKLGAVRMKPGVYQATDLSPQDLQTAFRDYTFKEPSPTLFQLNQFMIQIGEKLSASIDVASAIGANAPAATTLALIQQQEQSAGAIILRLYRAQTEEYKKLYALNFKYLDEERYRAVLDDPEASIDDFNINDLDIVPSANPEASSKIQKLQLAEAQMSQLEAVQLAGGNIKPIVENFYASIGSQQTKEIFPEPTEEEIAAQQQQELIAAQQQQEQIDFNNEAIITQLELAERDVEVREAKTELDIAKAQADIEKTQSETEKNEASTIKILEEAETEQTKNIIDTYTAETKLDKEEFLPENQSS